MGVTIKQKVKGGPYYIFVCHNGQRKAKCVGGSLKTAQQVKQQIEARLALGDFGILTQKNSTITVEQFAETFLAEHASHLKPSSQKTYEQHLNKYVLPEFGRLPLTSLTRDHVRRWLGKLAVSGAFTSTTLQVYLATLRTMMTAAIEQGFIRENPATRVNKFTKTAKPGDEAQAMTFEERDRFLDACQEVCPDLRPFFATAVLAGLRKGEDCALQVGDLQFGASEEDSNRFILVQRNYVRTKMGTPKNGKPRRVDMSKRLRGILIDRRDALLLKAMQAGKTLSPETFLFSPDGVSPVSHGSSRVRDAMVSALERAGLRHFRIHDLRHTFGSLLIQSGASLVYVQRQMGHSTIQITADIYGHLVPGADIACVDAMAAAKPKTDAKPDATPAQPLDEREIAKLRQEIEAIGVTSVALIADAESFIIRGTNGECSMCYRSPPGGIRPLTRGESESSPTIPS